MNNFDYIHELLIKILKPVSKSDCRKTFILAFETLKSMSQNHQPGYTELCFNCSQKVLQELETRKIEINSNLINLNFIAQEEIKSQKLNQFFNRHFINYNSDTLLIISRLLPAVNNINKNGDFKPFVQFFNRKDVEILVKANQITYLKIQSKLEKYIK